MPQIVDELLQAGFKSDHPLACPRCNHKFVIQIADTKTLQWLWERAEGKVPEQQTDTGLDKLSRLFENMAKAGLTVEPAPPPLTHHLEYGRCQFWLRTRATKKNLREQIRQAFGPKPLDAQRKYLFDAVGYEPSPEQENFHFLKDEHQETPRFKLAVGGEQAGKSYSAAMELFSYLPWGELFWIVGPDYAQTHNEFNYIWEALEKIDGLDSYPSMPEKGSWTLRTVWGAEIVTKSSDDPAKIAGRAPDGILLVEAAQCPETVFLRCMGRAAPKRGWVCVNGTFENEKFAWYRLKYLEWRGQISTAADLFAADMVQPDPVPGWPARS